MEKTSEIIPFFTENIPSDLEEGKLYISEEYSVAVHLCACGCKNKSVTPLKKGEWELIKNGDKVSLKPSIGNFSGEAPDYHAHYYITENKINWC